MKLGAVKHKDSIVLDELFYPSGETIIDEVTGEKVTFEVYSPKAKEYRHRAADLSRELATEQKRRHKRAENSGYTYDELEAAEDILRRQAAIKLKSWTGVRDADGEILECTPENAARVFADHDYAQRQVDVAHNDQAAFFEK